MTDKTNIQTVTGFVASKNGLTLFFKTGASEIFPAQSWNTQAILQAVIAPITEHGEATIDLAVHSIADKITALTNGKVKFDGDKVEIAGKKVDSAPLKTQMERAAFENATGFKKFVADFGKIKHGHRIEDLMAFMGTLDLPLADDGSIIAYKALREGPTKGTFADCHTGRVVQRVGSVVEMDIAMVNADRTVHCAPGLHICSRDYLRSFGGAHLVLVKINARDVVSVPTDTRTKVRVARYHIVAEVPTELKSAVVNANGLLTTAEGQKLLANIIAGEHASILEVVHVGAAGASNVVPLKEARVTKKTKVRAIPAGVSPTIDVGDIRKKVKAAKQAKTVGPVAPPKKKGKTPPAKKVETPAPTPVKAPKTSKTKAPSMAERHAEISKIMPHLSQEYVAKLIVAQDRIKAGESLRVVAKLVKLDRESMSNNLKRLAA